MDLDEFRTMVTTCRVAANLFTGNEELNRLTESQMVALLLENGQKSTRDQTTPTIQAVLVDW